MKRFLVSFAFALAIAAPVSAAELRSSVTVAGDSVTLGDLFDDAGDAADVTIAEAPAPGLQSQISISSISLSARRNGIQWRNTSDITHVTVARSGMPVSEEIVSATLASAIQAQMPSVSASAKMQIDFTNGASGLQVAQGAEHSLRVEQLQVNPRSGQFVAIVRAPANDAFATLRRLTGRAYPILEIPVLNREIAPGDVVREADLDWVKLPTERVSQNIVTSASQLVGMSPRRPVRMGEPLRLADMQPPLVIKKGDLVEVAFNSGALTLTARGRAMQSGAVGDTIDIVNPRSNRTLQGVVEGPNRIRMGMPGFSQTAATPVNSGAPSEDYRNSNAS